MRLNEAQARAVAHENGPCLVLAGPGSGKTAVITHRIRHLICEAGADPSSILVITFTRAAAAEMRERYRRLSGSDAAGVTFGTFHAVFFAILKAAYRLGPSNILSEEERYRLLRQLLSRYPAIDRDEREAVRGLMQEIGVIKNNRLSPEQFRSAVCGEEIFREIYRDYESHLRDSRRFDFDDMLTCTYELFDQRKDILSSWQKKYRYILIDEFQDVSAIQYDTIRMLAEPENNLFIVGDDDQSIYRFRGSRPEIMLGFPNDYPDAVRIVLGENYRCSASIVAASGRLIQRNRRRFPKRLFSTRKGGQAVAVESFAQQREEYLYLLARIRDGIAHGRSFGDYAVLYRTNTQPRYLMNLFSLYNLPYRVRDHIPNLYEHWIVRDIFTYIRLARGSRRRKDFLTVMNRPKRYLGRDSLEREEVSFPEWIAYYENQPWAALRIQTLRDELMQLKRMNPYASVNFIRKGIGYDDFLEEYARERQIPKEELFEVLEELQQIAGEFRSFADWERQIGEYKRTLSKKEREREDADGIALMTLHSAKGLEFPVVFLIDVNEGLVPYQRAVLEEEIEEERRLFYVGMTRAADELYLLSSGRINGRSAAPSRFLAELSAETPESADEA